MTESPSKVKLAVLGPLGTFSHQIAIDTFDKNKIDIVPQRTIKAVEASLGQDGIEWGFVPRENSIFGIVTETYDLLAPSRVGESLFIRGETTLHVQQCLLARRATDLSRVRRVLSHEQALGQCSAFIAQNFPGAALVKTTSTAAAAEIVAQGDGSDVAIGSRVCAFMYDEIEVVAYGIQQDSENYTRFFLLGTSEDAPLPPASRPSPYPQTHYALLRIHPRQCSITSALEALSTQVTQIDRRPYPGQLPFSSVYFVEAQQLGSDLSEVEDVDEEAWRDQVLNAKQRAQNIGADAALLGYWTRSARQS